MSTPLPCIRGGAPPLKRLSVFSFLADNQHNPFSPHSRGEKVRMRGPFLTSARKWLGCNGFLTAPLTPTLSPQALRGEGLEDPNHRLSENRQPPKEREGGDAGSPIAIWTECQP